MRKIKSRLIAIALLAGFMVARANANITYAVNQNVGGVGSATGTITTDGTIGILGPSNIVAFDLKLYDGINTVEVTNLNGATHFIGPDLTASAEYIFFNFYSGTAYSQVVFYNQTPGPNYGVLCYEVPTNNCAGVAGSIDLYNIGSDGNNIYTNYTTLGPQIIATAVSGTSFPYGFFATSSTCSSNGGSAPFSLAGGASVDGYNSANGGSYSSTVQNSLGNIGSNGSVVLSGGARVGGDISVLNTPVNGKCALSDVFISGGATYGGLLGISAYNPAVPSIPAAGTTNVSLSGAKRETLAGGSYGNISLSGASSLTLAAPGTFNINCLQLSGGTTLTISPATEPVVLNVSGTSCSGNTPVNFSGGSMENPSGIASNFQINYAGTGKINLSGGASTYLVVNAPNAAVTLSGGSDLFGAIIGNTIAISGGVSLHFDSALQ